MEQLKMIKEQLIAQVQGQMGNLQDVDAKELGEVVDMIKDLAEATYYCTITEAMEEGKKEDGKKEYHYYSTRYLPDRKYPWMPPYDDTRYPMEGEEPYRMYYSNGNGSSGSSSSSGSSGSSSSSNGQSSGGNNATGGGTRKYPDEIRDVREGQSPIRRKYYMEAKEMNHDKSYKMQQLESYLNELSHDITEMIQGATPEETMMLKQKLSTLHDKIM